MQKSKYSSEYYVNVGTYKICQKIVPGWYYNIQPVHHDHIESPWYFTYFPNFPTFLCDAGHVVNVPFRNKPISIYKWIYIDLGQIADEYGYPLGLSFTHGKSKEIPKYVHNVISFIISKYGVDNVITQEEAIDLAEQNETEKPVQRISLFSRRKHSYISSYKPHFHNYRKQKEKLQKQREERIKKRQGKYLRRKLKQLKERRRNGLVHQDCLPENCQTAD